MKGGTKENVHTNAQNGQNKQKPMTKGIGNVSQSLAKTT